MAKKKIEIEPTWRKVDSKEQVRTALDLAVYEIDSAIVRDKSMTLRLNAIKRGVEKLKALLK
jgi:hypothetical protein